MSCSPSPSGPGSNDTTNTSGGTSGEAPAPVPETPVTANNIPSVSTILEKIPISIEEYESYLNQSNNTNNSIFSTNFTVVPSPLSNEDEAGIKSGDINSKINSTADMFFTILKNDLKNLEIQSGTVFTVPSDFSVSAATESQIGVSINEYIQDWGKLEVRYNDESKEVRIFWKFSILSGDGNPVNDFIYIKGIFNDNNYESVESSFKTVTGNITTEVYEKFYKEENAIIQSIKKAENNGTEEFIYNYLMIKNNGLFERYDTKENTNGRIYSVVNYKNSQSSGFLYNPVNDNFKKYSVYDNNDFLVLELNCLQNNSYKKVIPLHFISHPNKEITKDAGSTDSNGNTVYNYYVDGNSVNYIKTYTFSVKENNNYVSKHYPCYELNNSDKTSFSLTDGFTFIAQTMATQGIQKIDELKVKMETSAVTDKFLAESIITPLQNELNTWVNALN